VQPLPFEWIAGDPALDFHNTVSWGRSGLAQERLRSYSDLVAWGRAADLVPQPRSLLARARRRPPEAAQALGRALGLRSVVHAVFTAIADGRAPEPDELRDLNGWLSDALGRLRVAKGPRGFAWSWTDTDSLDTVLAPIVWAAARLLTSDELVQLGRCANEDCGWLFVDRSRRRNRRWCEMGQCGSRAKARRYYARRRARRTKPASR
jgi:predicted RNA-binding Zn ribbon-like protein